MIVPILVRGKVHKNEDMMGRSFRVKSIFLATLLSFLLYHNGASAVFNVPQYTAQHITEAHTCVMVDLPEMMLMRPHINNAPIVVREPAEVMKSDNKCLLIQTPSLFGATFVPYGAQIPLRIWPGAMTLDLAHDQQNPLSSIDKIWLSIPGVGHLHSSVAPIDLGANAFARFLKETNFYDGLEGVVEVMGVKESLCAGLCAVPVDWQTTTDTINEETLTQNTINQLKYVRHNLFADALGAVLNANPDIVKNILRLSRYSVQEPLEDFKWGEALDVLELVYWWMGGNATTRDNCLTWDFPNLDGEKKTFTFQNVPSETAEDLPFGEENIKKLRNVLNHTRFARVQTSQGPTIGWMDDLYPRWERN